MTTRKPLIASGVLMGAGMAGFVDGIVFHQILQFHNMVSGWLPPSNLVDATVNMFWDGVFHAAAWVMTAVGLWLLLQAGMREDVPWSGNTLLGAWFAGWGIFNTVEGLIDHLILGIHHVNEYAPHPLTWDLMVQASGIMLIVLGRVLISGSKGELAVRGGSAR